MSARRSSLRAPETPRRDLALAVCLGNRTVGLALVTRERLLRAHAVTLHRVPGPKRAAYLTAVLSGLVDAYQPGRIVVVEPPSLSRCPLAGCVRGWTERLVGAQERIATSYAAVLVRASQVGDRCRATNRNLASVLTDRFPELRTLLGPSANERTPRWSHRAPVRTPRERYCARVVLAIAGALHDLDADLKRRLCP